MTQSPTFDLQILRNLRKGDVVWVHVGPMSDSPESDSYLESLRDAVLSETEGEVAVIITPADLVHRVSVLSLRELFDLRDLMDRMIVDKVAAMPVTEG